MGIYVQIYFSNIQTINTSQNAYLIWIKFSAFYVKTKRK